LTLLAMGPAVAPALAEDGDADPPEDLDDHDRPAIELTRPLGPGMPGLIAAYPSDDGLRYKRLTPIEPREWETPNVQYRWLLHQIEAGVADTRIMRMHHWLKERLAPFDRPIPEGWREAALERLLEGPPRSDDAVPRGLEGSDAPELPREARWKPIGPTTIPGRVTGLSRYAGRGGWILAAMADGGLWLSRDNGQAWEPLTEREATQASGAVAATPDGDVIFWGTGEGNGAIDNYSGIGVLRSEDGGRTWEASDAFSSAFRCLKVDPRDDERVWACGDNGIYRSDDSARTWEQVGGGLPTDAGGTALVFRPGEPATMFAGIWGRGLWRSDDGGETWNQVEGGLPGDLGRHDVAICESNPNVMALASGVDGGDLWKSADGGETWTAGPNDIDHCGGQCWYDNVVGIAPDDCETIYLNGIYFHASRDGGATWNGASGIHVDHHAILTGPEGEVIVGDDGGVYRSTDFGQTFQNASHGLPSTQYYGACGSDVDDEFLAGGTQDRGSHRHRPEDGWSIILGGDGGMCAIGGHKMLGEYQNTNLRRSLNYGGGFVDANAGIRPDDPKAWVGIIEKDPGDQDTLYVGTNRVYQTRDFHDTPWEEIHGPYYFGRMIKTIAASPADGNVVWVGYELGGVYRAENALSSNPTFQDRKANIPNRTVRRIVPHPTDVDAAWVLLSGYGNPKVMYTNDAGQSYVDVTGDMPDVPVNDMIYDPGDLDTLIIATDLGIYRSLDGGDTWHGFSEGLPTAAVVELFRHPADETVIAATHGRSMFRLYAVSPDPVAVPDGSTIGGAALDAEKTAAGDLWLRYDTKTCTAHGYHLFWAPLSAAAAGPYEDAVCELGRTGEAVVAMPGGPGESVFFVVAGANGSGEEGPHGYRSDGTVRPHSGVGLCGVSLHAPEAACP
jgi:photosystem II stability/assembly factor-like uncharacterized protein